MSKKKKPDKTIKIKKQEFHLSKGSSLFDDGRSKENVKEDARWFSSRGFYVRTREINGKHFLYVGKKKKKNHKKKGMVQKLVDDHDRRVGEKIPENTKESRRSHTHWGRWICIGACIIGFIIAVGVGIYYLQINPLDFVRGMI